MVKTDFTKVQDNHRRGFLRDQNHRRGPLAKYLMGAAIVILAILVVGAALGIAQILGDDGAETTVWNLEQELAAIRGNSRVTQVVPNSKEWTLEDELGAIRSNSTVHQPEAKAQPTRQQSGPR